MQKMRVIKNEVELDGMRKSHVNNNILILNYFLDTRLGGTRQVLLLAKK